MHRNSSPSAGFCKFPNQKVALLIDHENLSIYADRTYGKDVDLAKLMDTINGREIVRAILYRPAPKCGSGFEGLRSFLERKLGIEVRTPPKNADCWLTIDAVTLAGKVDVVALAAGDGDYEPLVHYLKASGCRVEVWAWPGCTALRLREAADRFVPLGEGILREREANPEKELRHTSLSVPA